MRLAIAVLLLAVFVVMAVRLTPPFFENRDLQAHIEQVAVSPESAALHTEVLRMRLLERVRRMGLPVRGDQIRITRSKAGTSIDIRYVVPVDFYLTTIDLHFHPRGGVR